MSRIRPISFNTDMVQAILDGRKTVTRRKVKFLPGENHSRNESCNKPTLYYPGDILYVQEAWIYENFRIRYLADEYIGKLDEWNSQFINEDEYNSPASMKKEEARIWLKVTDVRLELLHEMNLDDFIAEGVCLHPEAFNDPENAYGQAKSIFKEIWDSTIKKADRDRYGWDANPWVWVIEFEQCEKPEEN